MKRPGDRARRFETLNNPRLGVSSRVVPGTNAHPVERVNYEQFFLSQLPVVDKVTGHVCRRNHLRDADAEEFASEVKLHLIQNDYAVLRRFQQRSSLQTYLTVVVQRLFVNYRNRLWGRWRPSADASRLGPIAVQLERLIVRDGWSFEEAQEQLRINHQVQQTCES